MSNRTKQKYPVSIPEVSEAEIKLLIEALQTDTQQSIFTQNAKTYDEHTHSTIKSLPPSLRAKLGVHLFPTPAFFSTAALCNVHKGLNKYLISHMIRMFKREVEGHLEILTGYSQGPLDPYIDDAVCTLRSLAGMWWAPSSSSDSNCPKNPVPYQTNKCEACMITRILMDPICVQYLRATVHSRVRTTCNYRAPKLRRVTEAIMKTYNEKRREKTIMFSTKLVLSLKRARKEAFRTKHRYLYGGQIDERNSLSQRRTPRPDNAARTDGQTLSSFTVDFCMIQETTSPEEAISPQEAQIPRVHSQPIHLVETSTNHNPVFTPSDAMFMSPEEATFLNDSENEEERQQQMLYEILDCYMGISSARTSIISPVSPDSSLNASASFKPYIISPLSPRQHSFPLCGVVGKGRNNEYDPTNGIFRLGPPRRVVDWGPILKRVKQGSPMDKLISQIGDLLDEQDGFYSRTASERADSYIAIIPEPEEIYNTGEDDEAVGEPSKSYRRDTMDTTWSFLLREC
ncbi:hypothetical protein BJY01DRAFT_224020 [Aspergillus pseudoustus]|uniref:Uncharacterized protein n=1 Tax=Aspergillus pseudoustus TaxID=1810923 RepID=A0ABR4J3Y7_9EURO